MEEEFRYPENDGIMVYDKISHRYVLTNKGVLEHMGILLEAVLNNTGDANPSTLPDRILRRVSQEVYLYIYQFGMNSAWIEFLLACYAPLRDTVREMLQAQLLYVLNNGFVSDYAGINVARGNVMEIEKIRGRAHIAPQVEQLANQFVPGLGYTLTYRGQLPCVPCEIYHKGY